MGERGEDDIFRAPSNEESTRERAGSEPVSLQRSDEPKRFPRTFLDPEKPEESAHSFLEVIATFDGES
jgi:hypothetical protein